MIQAVYLKKGKDESLKRHHSWVFSGALAYMDEGIKEGDTVRVISAEGELLGVGHFQLGTIAVRMLRSCLCWPTGSRCHRGR